MFWIEHFFKEVNTLWNPSKIKHSQTYDRDSHFSNLLSIIPAYVYSLCNAINVNKLCHGLVYINVLDISVHPFSLLTNLLIFIY